MKAKNKILQDSENSQNFHNSITDISTEDSHCMELKYKL
jgi:hypothetical protein